MFAGKSLELWRQPSVAAKCAFAGKSLELHGDKLLSLQYARLQNSASLGLWRQPYVAAMCALGTANTDLLP